MNEEDIGDVLEKSSSSESCSNEDGDSDKNLTQFNAYFACTSLSDQQVNSCDDYISESASRETELSKYMISCEESSHSTYLSDDQLHSKCSADVVSHRASENGICLEVTRQLNHEPATSRGSSRRATSRGSSRRATSRGSSRRATSRGSSNRAISSCQEVLHYTSVTPHYPSMSLPYYQATSVPYYQATSVPYYQATSVPCYQDTSVPCCRSCAGWSCPSCARPCYHPCAGPCCLSCAGPCCLSCAEPCCRSSAGSSSSADLAAERTLSYQAIAIPSYQTVAASRYRAGTSLSSRRISFSRPRACLGSESKINPRRGVVTFPRRRRGRHPLHTRFDSIASNRATRNTFENLDVAGSSRNQGKDMCLQLSYEDEQSQYNRQQQTSSSSNSSNNNSLRGNNNFEACNISSNGMGSNNISSFSRIYEYANNYLALLIPINEEKDSTALGNNKNNISQISDSSNCNYSEFFKSKNEMSNISDSSDSNNEIIRNPQSNESKIGSISELSDGKSINRSNRDTSIKDIHPGVFKNTIYTCIDSKGQENSRQEACRFSRENPENSFQMVSWSIDEKIRNLNELIRNWNSVDIAELDVSDSDNNTDASSETFASNSSQKGLVDSFLESSDVDVEREYFYQSCQDQSAASNTTDKNELEKHAHLASGISIVQEFCMNLNTKCKRVAAKANKLLLKNTKFASNEEFRIHRISFYNIRIKMQHLEGIIIQLRDWCEEYYDDIKTIFAESSKNSCLRDYWLFWIKQLDKTLKLLDKLSNLCRMHQA